MPLKTIFKCYGSLENHLCTDALRNPGEIHFLTDSTEDRYNSSFPNIIITPFCQTHMLHTLCWPGGH